MNLISVKKASELINAAENTIRNWIEEKKIKKYEDESGKLLVDKRELLENCPSVICFFNQKGGVSKTDSCTIMADYYEMLLRGNSIKDEKKRMLIIDFDPQASISYHYFTDKELYGEEDSDLATTDKLTLYHFFENKTPLNKIVRYYNDMIDVLPADINMVDKANIDSFELPKLKDYFIPLFKKYAVVLIDTPPAVNAFSRLGLLLSNYVICPILATANSYRALARALTNIKDVVVYNKDFIDLKCFISANRRLRTVIREYYIKKYQDDLKSNLLINAMPDFVGIPERETEKVNIFDKYKNDSSNISLVKKLLDEIDEWIYDKRGIDG